MPPRVPPEVSRQREIDAWTYIQNGWSQQEIAAELKVTPSAVSQMLDRIERRLLPQFEKRVKQQKVRQIAILERVVGECLKAWDESKKAKNKASRKTKTISGVPASDDKPGKKRAAAGWRCRSRSKR